MAGMCDESFAIHIIVLFCNGVAKVDVLESKGKMRIELDAIEQRLKALANLPWHSFGKRLKEYLRSWRDRLVVHIRMWRHKLPEEDVKKCLDDPEFKFLKYLYKLTERMANWRAFPNKHLPASQLPKEFIDVKGPLDPPLTEYDHLCRIQEIADALIPAEMQRTMFAVMLSTIMRQPRQLTPAHKE